MTQPNLGTRIREMESPISRTDLREQKVHDARQVTSPDQLVLNKYFVGMHVDANEEAIPGQILLITGVHKPKENWFEAKTSKGIDGCFSMADRGIISYRDGWNSANFLMPADSVGRPLPLSSDKIHPRALYIQVESIIRGHSRPFSWSDYGPFNNVGEVKRIRPLIDHLHKEEGDAYTSTYVCDGKWLIETYADPSKIISPQDFLEELRINGLNEVDFLKDALGKAKAIFSESSQIE